MEALHTFGFDATLLVAQIVNFLVILYLLKRFLYKPTFAYLEKRKRTIEDGLAKAEEGRQMLEKASEKERMLLKKAQEEAKKLLAEARNQRVLLLKETQDLTKKQTEKMLEEARIQITRETKEAEKRLSTHISELSMVFLQKSITGLFTAKEQNDIIKHAVLKMKGKTN